MRFVLLWASIPPVSFLLASTGLFELRIRSPGSTPPGSQGAAQCSLSSGQGPRVTLLMAANRARVCIFPSFWPLVLASACGLRSPIWPHLAAAILPTQPRPALPYASGPNASGFAAASFSAPLASSMLAVPLARPGMAPTTGSAPLAHAHRLPRIQLRPRRCSWNHGGASKPKRACVFMSLTPSTLKWHRLMWRASTLQQPTARVAVSQNHSFTKSPSAIFEERGS